MAEAIPGVPTPLSWSLWGPAMEGATWEIFRRTGAYSKAEIGALRRGGIRAADLFYGHCAGNVNLYSDAIARMGGDAAGFEHQIFGIEPDGGATRRSWHRLPFALVRIPLLLVVHPRELTGLRRDTALWWRASISEPIDRHTARALLADSAERFEQAMTIQVTQTLFSQAAFDLVAKVAHRAGRPGLENSLVSATAELDELRLAGDLWSLSKGGMALEDFLAEHGHHGPNNGELSAESWRENPGPVMAAAERYAEQGEGQNPAVSLARQRSNRDTSLELLRSSTGGLQRWSTSTIVALAGAIVPKREVGKTALMRVLDVARHAARTIGADLAARGLMDNPADVFYLTLDEVLRDAAHDWRQTVAVRRSRRAEYESVELPDHWTGNPDPISLDDPAGDPPATLRGIAAASGQAVGRARVIVDAVDSLDPLTADEILVTRTTDPSWVAMFMGAGGLVIDVGGPMSHGAIVARALGVPCVINALDATRRIPDGALICVDGDQGTVMLL